MYQQALKCNCGMIQSEITLKRAGLVGNLAVYHCCDCQ